MNVEQSVGTRAENILSEALRLIKAAKWETAVFFVTLTGMSFFVELRYYTSETGSPGGDVVVAIANIILIYFLLISIIRKVGLKTGPVQAGGTYFGIALLSSLATLFGLLLLIIPGIILYVRWMPAYGYALIEGKGTVNSLSHSYAQTDGHFWPILIALLAPMGLFALGAIFLFVFEYSDMISLEFSLFIANSAFTVSSIAITAIGLAIYSLLNKGTGALANVFE